MPRTYIRKTQRQDWDPNKMIKAIEAIQAGMPKKTAARQFGVPVMTLKRRVAGKNVNASSNIKCLGSKKPTFSSEQEEELVVYILNMETRMYGLSTRDVRNLAYQLAEINGIKHNFSHEQQSAGKDWLKGFRERHPNLTLRLPEATSLARAMGFNRPVITKYYNILREDIKKKLSAP